MNYLSGTSNHRLINFSFMYFPPHFITHTDSKVVRGFMGDAQFEQTSASVM